MTELPCKICPTCGREFTRRTDESLTAFNKKIFCSNACRIKSRCAPKLTFYCENPKCGKLIVKTVNKAGQARHHLCSNECKVEWRKKYQIGRMAGPKHPFYNKPRSPEVIEKMKPFMFKKGQVPHNKGQKGLHKDSPETKIKKSLAAKGKKKSEMHRRNIALAKMGPNNPQFGKPSWNYRIPQPLETIEKLRKAKLSQEITTSKPEGLVEQELLRRGVDFRKNIPEEGRTDFFVSPNKHLFVDGDFYHVNPIQNKRRYTVNDRIFGTKTAGDIWCYDAKIIRNITAKGGQVMRFWQSEIEKDVALCVDMFLSGNFVTVIKKDGTREHIPVNDKT